MRINTLMRDEFLPWLTPELLPTLQHIPTAVQ